MINVLKIGDTYLNIIKVIYKRLTVSIILNGEKPKRFLLKSRTTLRYPLSPYVFKIVLQVLGGQ